MLLALLGITAVFVCVFLFAILIVIPLFILPKPLDKEYKIENKK